MPETGQDAVVNCPVEVKAIAEGSTNVRQTCPVLAAAQPAAICVVSSGPQNIVPCVESAVTVALHGVDPPEVVTAVTVVLLTMVLMKQAVGPATNRIKSLLIYRASLPTVQLVAKILLPMSALTKVAVEQETWLEPLVIVRFGALQRCTVNLAL